MKNRITFSKLSRRSFLKVSGLGTLGSSIPSFGFSRLSEFMGGKNHITIFKHIGKYAAFPILYQLEERSTLYTEFRSRPSGSHIDPRGETIRMISRDGGSSWKNTKEKINNPDYRSSAAKWVDANAYGWRYVDPAEREKLQSKGIEVRDSPDGKIAYAYGCYKRSSLNGGKKWKATELEVPPVALIMKYLDPCTYLRISDRIILRAVYGRPKAGVHFYESWLLRSEDNGKNWEFLTIGRDPNEKIGFGETALAQAENGDIIAMMRTQPPQEWKYLYSTCSTDQGKTWSKPINTGIQGHPAHLLRLGNGRLLCTYGYRTNPMGIRAVFSHDNGKTWDLNNIRILRDDANGRRSDVGYPISVQRQDGKIFTIYYITTGDGITHVAGTIWNE